MSYPAYDKLASMSATEMRELLLEMESFKGKSKGGGHFGNKKSCRELHEFSLGITNYTQDSWFEIYKAITYLADITFSNFIKSNGFWGRKYCEGKISRPTNIPNWINADEYMQFVDEIIALMKKYKKPRHVEDLTKNEVLENNYGETN